METNPDVVIQPPPPNPNLYAVFITGWFWYPDDGIRFWKDNSAMYTTLKKVYGYTDENIFVHYFNGTSWQPPASPYQEDFDHDGTDDMDYNAEWGPIENTFKNLSGEWTNDPDIPALGPDDQLFIFFDGHGGYNSNLEESFIYLYGPYLYGNDLKDWLQNINCSQMIILMEPCNSGGFVDYLSDIENVQCDQRIIQTACLGNEVSWQEYWLTGVNFNEFVFYWTAAARGWYPSTSEPWEESIEVGYFPFSTIIPEFSNHEPDYNPDINDDGFVQMEEAFDYANDNDTWSWDGYYNPYFEWAETNWETPQRFSSIDFVDDVSSLYGICGEIRYANNIIQGNFTIGGPLYLSNNATLTILPNSNLYFINDYVIIDDEEIEVNFTIPFGHNLVLQNDVSFNGYDDPNSIDVYGDIEFGHNNRFLSLSGNTWEGMNLLNEDANIVIDGATFEKCGISGNPEYLNLDNLDFSNGFIDLETTNVDLDNSEFYHSNFKDIFGDRTSFVNINNCSFDHSWTNGIYINNFYSYQIKNCTINNCLDGIKIFNSGSSGTASIYQNLINDNIDDGIELYNSHVYLNLNNIRDNNGDGISLHDNSFVSLTGNKGAHFVSETQRLRDNGMYELFTDEGSFPEKFRWNAIIDEDNESDGYELVYCETTVSNEKDVRYNYWGSEENFDPVQDFYPSEDYVYLPLFYLEDDEEETGADESLFNSAEENFNQESYTVAKSEYKQVIEQYPDSKFAKASIKQLFSVEEFEFNDYLTLKQYYRTNTTILNHFDLAKLADFYANKCDIKLENWQVAIDWFEYKIQNPESFADSLYAIIDLGNTYFLMEQNGYKSAYSGNRIEHIPTSTEQYNIKRDFLISLLPQDNLRKRMKDNLSGLNEGELLQNVPNPFKGITQIWYKLNTESDVQLKVYNYTGQLIKSINEGTKTKGTHHIDFNANGLKNGIYFYSISINGQTTDSKKMTVME